MSKFDDTVYAIHRGDGYFVDRGGRRTISFPQMFLWNCEADAQAYLDKGTEKMYLIPAERLADFRVVPVEVSIV